nr:MAG TPA: hypothetical protein [Caudoviricetes sp.]
MSILSQNPCKCNVYLCFNFIFVFYYFLLYFTVFYKR